MHAGLQWVSKHRATRLDGTVTVPFPCCMLWHVRERNHRLNRWGGGMRLWGGGGGLA